MGRKLSAEIKGCEKWSLVFVDPEHLKDPEWREITEWPVFRANIVFGCVDEAHLI
jgi:superfamily II DNA helicase RecQ